MTEKTTKELLDQLLSRLQIDDNDPIVSIHHEWIEIVGHDLASHAKLKDIRGKVLIIETDHPTWSSMVMMKRKQILARVKAQFPELGVTQVQVRTSSG